MKIVVIRIRMIIKRFIKAGATSPASAKTPREAGVFEGSGFLFSRLTAKGILVRTGSDKYYVDISMLKGKYRIFYSRRWQK